MGKELEYSFIKDTSEEYERKRKIYKQNVKRHNPSRKYYNWKWQEDEFCKCKDCNEAYAYLSLKRGHNTSLCACDHPKSAFYTQDSMEKYLIKCLGKHKYNVVTFLATILEEWDDYDGYITCKIKYH